MKTDIQLYEELRLKLGASEAEAVTNFVDEKLNNMNVENTNSFVTKEDLKDSKFELKQQVSDLNIALTLAMSNNRTESQRWMLGIFFGLIALFLKK